MKDASKKLISKSAEKLATKIQAVESELQLESKTRSDDFGVNSFFNRNSVIAVSIFLFASLSLLILLMAPARNLGSQLAKNPNGLFLVNKGQIYFDPSLFPPQKVERRHDVELPFRKTQELQGYSKSGIWYEFALDVPEEKLQSQNTGVLIPMVWGRSRVFLNEELRDFGFNNIPIIPLVKNQNVLKIRADLENTNRINPISATFPLIIGDIDRLRSIKKGFESEFEVHFRALSIYCLAILLFGMLYLAFPKKPELLAFISFLFLSLANSALVTANDLNASLIKSFEAQQGLLLSLDYLTNLTALVFSLYFLRAHPKSIRDKTWQALLVSAFLVPPIALLFFKAFNSGSFRQAGHLAINCSFMAFQAYYVWPRLFFAVRERSVPRFRKIACALVSSTIGLYYAANILDYFSLLSGITTLQSNGLILNVTLAITVAFEVSRAEKNQKILGSMLPKEVRETLNLASQKVNQRGFIILVDAIGYSADRERFDNVDVRSTYIEKLARKILRPLSELNSKDFSILNCTGDGIYCAIRGEAAPELLNSAIAFAEGVTTASSDENEILFRAAIGYGSYSVSIVEVGSIRKEFVAGNVLNDLSRVIGNVKDAQQVRVLVTKDIEPLIGNQSLASVFDKHGFEHKYVELEKAKRAA